MIAASIRDLDAKLMAIARAAGNSLRPAERLTVSQWAERYRFLSPEASVAQPWHTWPFQREPMDACGSDDPTDHVVVMAASQMLKTELLLCTIGRAICIDPGPIAVYERKDGDAEALSKDRIAPMIRDCPVLRQRVAEAKSRDSGNTINQKSFPGGTLYILGAMSASNLAMRPIRYLLRDEGNRWETSVENEGSPFALSERRTSRFWNRKIVDVSSPTVEGGHIETQFALSSRGYWTVPCPGCGGLQRFLFSQVKWGEVCKWEVIGGGRIERLQPKDAHYLCIHCEKLIPHSAKGRMNEAGRYIHEDASNTARKGYHVNALAYPIRSWGFYAEDFLSKKDNPLELQSFVNTALAETWREPGEKPDWQVLRGRLEPYTLNSEAKRNPMPEGVLFLTAGIDVQRGNAGKGWVRCDVWGWGRGRRSWLIDTHRIEGGIDEESTKQKLSDYVWNTKFRHSSGVEIQIECAAVDSGENAAEVYAWARAQKQLGRLIVVKGFDSGFSILGTPKKADITHQGKAAKAGVQVWPVNVSMAKRELYADLSKQRREDGSTPDGYIHLPGDVSEVWLKELTSEEWRQTRSRTGHIVGKWEQIQDRNEALDTRNYARAAASHLGIDRFAERHWAAREAMYPVEFVEVFDEAQQAAEIVTQPKPRPRSVMRVNNPFY